MKVIAVNGTSNSGKTTVCEVIIRGLREKGYSVGSVKEIHCPEFSLDPNPAEDTGRHRSSGSQLVTARAVEETDVLYQEKLSITEILKHYEHDYVILEGVADCNGPRILTAHDADEVEERLDGRVVAVSGVLANSHPEEMMGLPVFHALEDPKALVDFVEARAFEPLPSFDDDCCTQCGYTCRELTERIARQEAKREDCVLQKQSTELLINGTAIPMVPFVQSILRNAVLGVVRELEGYKEHSSIEVRIKP
jgi:molybdopterin-guanine dinucleotide biosynthesis protein B